MRERVLSIFREVVEPVDAIVLMNDVEPNLDMSFFYATGLDSGLFEQCAAILWPDGSSDLVVSALEETSARASQARLHVFLRKADRQAMLQERLRGVKRLGVCGSGLTYRMLQEVKGVSQAEIVDVWRAVEAARLVKDGSELERLRQACRIASEVGREIPGLLREGMSECEASAEITYLMTKRGASAAAFTTNASFGANSAEPHHSPGQDRLGKGDAALFDYGALYKRYGSDITRTFFFGTASAEQRAMYQVVLEAQLAAIGAIRAGGNGKDVDAVARRVIDSSPFKGRFIHSLGHGIGLSVHDGGRLAPDLDFVLREDMVLTVEPGVYLPGQGGVRIEDDVRVTRNGCELLTTAPKELLVI